MNLVTVVVPTKNAERTLGACLASVRQQTGHAVELIVVDNHSTDASVEIARRYADAVEIAGPERSAQRNLGARLSHGSFLFFVDADMVLRPEVTAKCLEALTANDTSAVAVPEVSFGSGFWSACKRFERHCYENDRGVCAVRFFERDAFERAGGYDDAMIAGEDWDLSMRVLQGKPLTFVQATLDHDEGCQSLSRLVAKKFYYGRNLHVFMRKHRAAGWRKITPLRPNLLRALRQLPRHPILVGGTALMKAGEMLAGLAGLGMGFYCKRSSAEDCQSAVV